MLPLTQQAVPREGFRMLTGTIDAAAPVRADSDQAMGADPALLNPDLAPTRPDERRWTARDFAVLWVSMAACVPTYMLASSLIAEGMSWWQAVVTIFLGNALVLVPMALNAHAG